jgi:hypothetical protein
LVNLEVMVAAKTRPNCQTSEPTKTPKANKPIGAQRLLFVLLSP